MTTTTLPMLTQTLDRLEANLPAISARWVRLQRTLAGAAYDTTAAVVSAFTTSTRQFLDTAKVSGKTVAGQARAAGDDVATAARTGAQTVAGQASAQGGACSRAATAGGTAVLDSAIDAVDSSDGQPGSGTPYEEWTKAQLLERAKELDIEGRSGLDKRGLIAALRSA